MAKVETTKAALPSQCAVLTPLGRGAIATIGVRGPGAIETVGRCFRPMSGKPLASFAVGSLVFGRFDAAPGASEELVVGLVASDQVEVHCHGGTAAVEAAMAALVVQGSEKISWQQWACERDPDPIAAAATIALAEARTERTAVILLEQLHGAMRHAIERVIEQLQHEQLQSAEQSLAELLSRAELGRHLTRPWRVVLAGPPNVGKSSLINALLGYQRAIVFDQPGTTRDVLTATTALDGWPVELADTAGLREGATAIEAAGIARALEQIAGADLVIELRDAAAEAFPQLPLTAANSLLIVYNKCDLKPPAEDCPPGLAVSAKTGQGIDQLCHSIAERLVPNPPPRGAGVPFSEKQIASLQESKQRLAGGDVAGAQQSLKMLLTSALDFGGA